MKTVVISEYEKEFQSKLNSALGRLSHNEVVDIKFSTTYDSLNEKIVLHAIILHK